MSAERERRRSFCTGKGRRRRSEDFHHCRHKGSEQPRKRSRPLQHVLSLVTLRKLNMATAHQIKYMMYSRDAPSRPHGPPLHPEEVIQEAWMEHPCCTVLSHNVEQQVNSN